MARPTWIDGLLQQPDVVMLGRHHEGRLVASLCLRPRKAGAYGIDSVNAYEEGAIESLVQAAVMRYTDHRLECFVKTGSPLHRWLEPFGFVVPEFFQAIGPLVEWRRGPAGPVGTSAAIQTLNWF